MSAMEETDTIIIWKKIPIISFLSQEWEDNGSVRKYLTK